MAHITACKKYKGDWWWFEKNERAVTEFVFYGIPWMKSNFPKQPKSKEKVLLSAETAVNEPISDIKYNASTNMFTRNFTFRVTDYTISQEDSFDFIIIPDTEQDCSSLRPVLPRLKGTLNLPRNTSITSLQQIGGSTKSLGQLNIPNCQASTTANPLPPFTDVTDVEGLYPEPNYAYDIDYYDDHIEVKIYFIPVQHNVDTKETILWEEATLEVQYEVDENVFISDFLPTKREYKTSENISTITTIENIGSEDESGLKAVLTLMDLQGQILDSTQKDINTISSGESQQITIDITNGLSTDSYVLSLEIKDESDATIAVSSKFIKVVSEYISDFSIPEITTSTEADIPFTVTFQNYNQDQITIDVQIEIYDEKGKNIATLTAPTENIPSDASKDITVLWNNSNKAFGNYAATAIGTAGSNKYASFSKFSISEPQPVLSVTPDFQEIAETSGTTTFTITNTGAGAMTWSVEVNPDDTWLKIDSGTSGTDNGTITLSYEANTSTARTAKITITADSAANSPQVVEVRQAEFVTLVPPANPETQSGTDSVKLTWNPSTTPSLAGYNIYRSMSETGPYSKLNTEPITGDHYADNSDLTTSTTYYYYLTTLDTSGRESAPSDITSVVFGHVKLFIPDSRGKSGTQVILPVNIANADGLEMCAADIYVTYDSTVLSATEIQKTALSAGYEWDSNLSTPGTARAVIAAIEGETLFGEGSLFYVLFDVNGNTEDTSDLKFEISGTYFYDCKNLIEPVPIDLDDAGIFTVSPDFIMGDLNGDGIVNSDDAALAMDIAVGNAEPDEKQMNAGDINGDTRITSSDATLIRRIAESRPLIPDSPDIKRMAFKSSPINVIIPKGIKLSASTGTWVPIDISNTADVAGADIILNYHPSLVAATNIRTTPITDNFDIRANTSHQGQARISLNARDGNGLPADSGPLVEVEFTLQPDISTDVSSPLTLANVRLNDTYGRDFATSALQTDVNTVSGTLETGFDLNDAIHVLKILAGISAEPDSNPDVNRDKKIGTEEVIFILQEVAGIRK
ncbi:MAG: hypothetical protein GY795_23990 [Desulfobacterales bacterium]|nr:hypothetical protein [Desulfobacterales bacterium]